MKEKKLANNIFFYSVKQICAILFPMIVYPYVTRTLGVNNLGEVEYAKSIVQYFVLIGGFGISDYAIREGSRIRDNKSKMNQFATQIIAIHAVSTCVAIIGVILISSINQFIEYRPLMLVFMLIIPFTFIGTEWLFGIYENYRYISIRTIIMQIVSFALTFVCIHNQNDYLKYAFILVLSTVGAGILNVPLAHRYFKLDFSQLEIKRHLKPIFLIFGMAVAGGFYTTMDTSMLGFLVGTVSVGYYAAANKLVNLIATFVGAVRTVLLPRLSYAVGTGDENTFKRINSNTLLIILMLAIPIAGGILCLSQDIILIFCGKSFVPGAVALRLLVPEIILSAVNGYIVYQIFLPLKKEKNAFICITSGAISNLCINLILIPIMQQNGAAIATCISEGVVLIVAIILSSKWLAECIDWHEVLKEMMKFFASGTVMTLICLVISNALSDTLMKLILTIPVGVIIYFSGLILMKEKICLVILKRVLERQKH